MNNFTAALEGSELVVRIPVTLPPRPSSTGKTLVVSSSHGNKPTDIEVNGQHLIVGVNAYIKP